MAKKKYNKFKNKRVKVDGIWFDSIAEGEYYLVLKDLKRKCVIHDFELQPRFVIQEKFKHATEGNIRAIEYKADFKVFTLNGSGFYVVDVKGDPTPDALNKRKMFLKNYPDIELFWIAKSKKYSDNGWIDYFKLKEIRKQNKKAREAKKK